MNNYEENEDLSELLKKVKRLDDKILEDRDLFRFMIETSTDGYWDWHIDLSIPIEENYEYMSPKFKSILGYKDDELENKADSWMKLIFPEDYQRALEAFNRHVETKGEYPYDLEVKYKHKKGHILLIRCAGMVVKWAKDGSPLRMFGYHRLLKSYHNNDDAGGGVINNHP